MEVQINHIDEFEKELKIAVPWESVSDEYNDLLKRYINVPIKGFRAGKAPVGLVESTFKSEIKDDFASLCAKRFCRKAMQDNDMDAASPLAIKDIEIEKGKRFSFTASFVCMPAFDLPDYKHLQLQAVEQEEKLDEISEKLLQQTDMQLHSSLVQDELEYSEIEGEQASAEDVQAAEDRVKLMLILKKIASKDSIEIDDKHVDERIEAIAAENGVTPEQLRSYLFANDGFSRLTDSLLAEQVLEYIIDIQE